MLDRDTALRLLPEIQRMLMDQEWKDWEYPQEWQKFKNRDSAKAEEREKRGKSETH